MVIYWQTIWLNLLSEPCHGWRRVCYEQSCPPFELVGQGSLDSPHVYAGFVLSILHIE
ncbi:hypothetical protein YC2023_073211 [Brassica napus]